MKYTELSRHDDDQITFEYRLAIAETDKDLARLCHLIDDTSDSPYLVALCFHVTLHHPDGDRLLSQLVLDDWSVRSISRSLYGAMVMDRAFLYGESLHPWHMAYKQRALDWLHWHDALQNVQRQIRELYPMYIRQYQAALKNHRLYKATTNGTVNKDKARAVGDPIFAEFKEERDILRQDRMAISASLLQAQKRLDAMSALSIDDDLSGSQNVDDDLSSSQNVDDDLSSSQNVDDDGEGEDENAATISDLPWAFWLVICLVVCLAVTIIALVMLANDDITGAWLSIAGTFWTVVCVKMLHKSAVVQQEDVTLDG